MRMTLLGAALVAAPSANAQPLLCEGRPGITEQTEAVAESWQVVLRNAFDTDGNAHQNLSAFLLVAVKRDGAEPCLAPYLVNSFAKSEDGNVTAQIVPTNRDYPVFFDRRVSVDPAMIIDWDLIKSDGGAHFGNLGARLSGSSLFFLDGILSDQTLPTDWQ